MGSRPQFSEAQALAGAALKTFSQATHHSVSLDQMGRQTHGPGRQHDQLLHRDVGDYDPISLTAATMTTAGTEVPAGRACLQNDQHPVDLSSHQIRCSYGPEQHLHPRLPMCSQSASAAAVSKVVWGKAELLRHPMDHRVGRHSSGAGFCLS